jgi:hypothetical protein
MHTGPDVHTGRFFGFGRVAHAGVVTVRVVVALKLAGCWSPGWRAELCDACGLGSDQAPAPDLTA